MKVVVLELVVLGIVCLGHVQETTLYAHDHISQGAQVHRIHAHELTILVSVLGYTGLSVQEPPLVAVLMMQQTVDTKADVLGLMQLL